MINWNAVDQTVHGLFQGTMPEFSCTNGQERDKLQSELSMFSPKSEPGTSWTEAAAYASDFLSAYSHSRWRQMVKMELTAAVSSWSRFEPWMYKDGAGKQTTTSWPWLTVLGVKLKLLNRNHSEEVKCIAPKESFIALTYYTIWIQSLIIMSCITTSHYKHSELT
jgi:hypothetical protein